ncbi:MAG TPA: LptA/OstA family protein, partial [Aestuariivirgaceae bacterium]
MRLLYRLALPYKQLGRLASATGAAATALILLQASPAAAKEDLLKTTLGKHETNQPLLLEADELVYDKANDLIIANGNVQVYYKNYGLNADQLTYDQKAKTLNAIGNVRIKEPDGSLVSADRITLTDDFAEGFIRSFKAVTKEEMRIAADNAYRKDNNTTVFERGVFTP